MRSLVLGGVVTLLAWGPGGSSVAGRPPAEGWRDDVSRFARRLIDAELTPGLGIAVAKDDWVVYERGFGTADRDAGRAVADSTLFYIASSTKSLTALAAVLAAQRGEIDLSAPMTRYLPDARLPAGVASDLRVEELLTLTHGLSGTGPIVFRTAFSGDHSFATLLALLAHHEPTGARGVFEYQNLGYNLVGMVLEARYGEPWKDVVDREVLRPVGMFHTSAYVSRLDPDRLALPHRLTSGGFSRVRLAKGDANLHAAGGHFSTAGDMARYVAAHLTGGRVEGVRVLPEAPIRLTHVKHAEQDRRFGPYHRWGWGYGWDLGTYDGETLVHRFGGFPGYRSHVSFMPDHGLGVVVFVNGDGPASPAADLMATYIYDRLLDKPGLDEAYGARVDEFVQRLTTGRERLGEQEAERRARQTPLARPLEDFTGAYENPVLGRMTWREVGGRLEVKMGLLWSVADVHDADAHQLRVELTGDEEVVQFEFAEPGPRATAVTYLEHAFVRSSP